MTNKEFDAIVVGSGPNGLSAAIVLRQAGLSVLLLEGKSTLGGGLRSQALNLPGYVHDICSAVHPMAVSSPFFNSLPLAAHGLEFIEPDVALAHPMESGASPILVRSISRTASSLGRDAAAYEDLIGGLAVDWPKIYPDMLGPVRIPTHLQPALKFLSKALLPATRFAKKYFRAQETKSLFAGLAAHSMMPLSHRGTTGIGLVLAVHAHLSGWPIAKGGSQSIADALASYFAALGGQIELNRMVTSLDQLPSSRAILLDVSPNQLLRIAGKKLSKEYANRLAHFKYGMGVCKMDWALESPIPFITPASRQAGTVHLGNSLEEIVDSEQKIYEGVSPTRPFVILAQPTVMDPTRAPAGKHIAWAYCHVPNGSGFPQVEAIENQIERFAPGFKETILSRHVFSAREMEAYNPNYVGGDIGSGEQNLRQLLIRPRLLSSPYKTSISGIYLCSASTRPGAGVHGMCGYYAAKQALKDIFHQVDKLSD